MNTRTLILLALTTIVAAGCASTPNARPGNCAATRIEKTRPDLMACNEPRFLRHPSEPFLERREQI